MGEQLIDGTGSGNFARIGDDNRLWVNASGTVIVNNLYAGSEVWQGTDPWIVLGSNRVVQDSTLRQISAGSVKIVNLSDLGSSVVVTNRAVISKSEVTNGSVWVNNSGAILTPGPRSGLIMNNLGPGNVGVVFGSPFIGSVGFELEQGAIYEMSDYFLYTGSISISKVGTGSSVVSFMEI